MSHHRWIRLAPIVVVAACHHAPGAPHGLPLAAAQAPPLATLVWVGHGEAERFVDGKWRRTPELDYDFTVEQRRYGDHWDSIKTMRRQHPAYDGVAGPRLQVYAFHLDVGATNGRARFRVASSLGDGTGTGDLEFRDAVLDLAADVSRFAPFDRYRITQHYGYEAGTLTELVELLDGDAPWVQNHERAALYAAGAYPYPPTTMVK